MTESKQRTITLTDAPPVRIHEDEWPVIAQGDYSDFNAQYESQASRTWRAHMHVRRHADGRMIVYGTYDYYTAWQGTRGFATRAGVLLDADAGEDVVAAIRQVGDTLAGAADEAGHEFGADISAAVRECIADLPAREL